MLAMVLEKPGAPLAVREAPVLKSAPWVAKLRLKLIYINNIAELLNLHRSSPARNFETIRRRQRQTKFTPEWREIGKIQQWRFHVERDAARPAGKVE